MEKITIDELTELISDVSANHEVIMLYVQMDDSSSKLKLTVNRERVTGNIPDGFDIDRLIYENTAEQAEQQFNANLQQPEFSYSGTMSEGRHGGYISPITIVAEGDSWTNLPPLFVLFPSTYVEILSRDSRFNICNIGYWGHTIEEISKDSQQCLSTLERIKPQFFMFTAGGNDLADAIVDIPTSILDTYDANQELPIQSYFNSRFDEKIDDIADAYRSVFQEVIYSNPTIKILCNGYDYARPLTGRGKHIGQYLDNHDFPDRLQNSIVKVMIQRLNEAIESIANEDKFKNYVTYIKCLDVTSEAEWWDDMHPNTQGFKEIANQYINYFNNHSNYSSELSQIQASSIARVGDTILYSDETALNNEPLDVDYLIEQLVRLSQVRHDGSFDEAFISYLSNNWVDGFYVLLIETMSVSSKSIKELIALLLIEKSGNTIGMHHKDWYKWYFNEGLDLPDWYGQFKAVLYKDKHPIYKKLFHNKQPHLKNTLARVFWDKQIPNDKGAVVLSEINFVLADEDTMLSDDDKVYTLNINGKVKIYPQKIISKFEIIQDATLLILSNGETSHFYYNEQDDQGFTKKFGKSGFSYDNHSLIYDTENFSLWDSHTGTRVLADDDKGMFLLKLVANEDTWINQKNLFPDSPVISIKGGLVFDHPDPLEDR